MLRIFVENDFGSKFHTTSINAAFRVAGSAQMYWIEPVSGS
jgi:hypothetical protein